MNAILNLLINGLSTGLLIFLLASGLTLIFGLMSVLNFAHGGFFVWGAFVWVWLFSATGNFFISVVGAIGIGMLIGFIFEKTLIRPVYGNHIRQLLVTLGVCLSSLN